MKDSVTGFHRMIMIIILICVIWALIRSIRDVMPNANRSGRGLYRSNQNRVIGGVCGGIAEQLNLSPVLIRLLWFISGIGFPIYILLWIIIPEDHIDY